MKKLGYLIFFLFLFYIFLLCLFPYQALKKNMESNFEEITFLKLKIGKIGPSWPFHFYLRDISLNSESLVVQIPDLRLQINLFSPLWGKKYMEIRNLQNRGQQIIRGKYYWAGKEGSLQILLQNSEIKASYENKFFLSLNLNGEANLKWEGENFERLNGQAWTLLKRKELEAKKEIKPPWFFTMIDTIRAELQIQDNIFLAKRLVLSGKEGKEIVFQNINLTELIKGKIPNLNLLMP